MRLSTPWILVRVGKRNGSSLTSDKVKAYRKAA
jgi:hypothetical protein